jgi:hypothetical protein
MHSRFRAKGVTLAVLAALTALLVLPGTSLAKPQPGAAGRGFRLQARAIGAITINRVYCGLAATGEVCVDSTNSSTIGGGYWPKGSPQQYVFNSGLQAAGAIDTAGSWAWAGDTTGAFFFDPKGTTQHGQAVQPIWNSSNPFDNAAWPAAARVPEGDAVGNLYDVNLQGRNAASQGDVWTVAWDGDPSLIAGRPHPLGIAVETRGMGWNYPTGNNDIIYFTYTFYNVSASTQCLTDQYASIRPAMKSLMQGLGDQFQTLNNAAFGVTIPKCGYTIKNFFANFAADMDVSSDAGNNYSSVNLPFQLGYVYEDSFRKTEGTYRLPPDAGQAPFTGGYGFVGVKYLASPIDPATSQQAGLHLFSNTVNGSSFNDPANVQQLYRYISGNIQPALGDGLCNFVPATDKICFVKKDGHADMRFFQSSGPFDLPPGGFGTIVVAYIFASPVAVAGCPAAPCGVTSSVAPNNPLGLIDAATLATNGADLVDSLTGFSGYKDDNGDNVVQQSEIRAVKGSLLNKAAVAQTVFDGKFLLPSAPSAPEYFLVPGDNQVAVFWRPSSTEATGDLFYASASTPTKLVDPDGAGPLPAVVQVNLLYDPNYRQFDVEGYRVYRGRVDDPSALALLAQYDYAGTNMKDFLGAVNPSPSCAPELGLKTTPGCPVNFSTPIPGIAYTGSSNNDIVTPFVQVKVGSRVLLANSDSVIATGDTLFGLNPPTHPVADSIVYTDGRPTRVLDSAEVVLITDTLHVGKDALVIAPDTAVTGRDSDARPELNNSGIPFVYVDKTAKNNLRYFYAVTAFDVNSIQSGPTTLESARVTKSATPVAPGTNYDNVGNVSIGIFGRGVNMTVAHPKAPGINAALGTFTGPARPATGAAIGFVGDFVKQVVKVSGELSLTLDSMHLGSAYDVTTSDYFFTIVSAVSTTHATVSVAQDQFNGTVTQSGTIDGGPIDSSAALLYGGSTAYHLTGSYDLSYAGNYYTAAFGRGCANAAPGFTSGKCSYGGARWFTGANETFPHPTRGNFLNNAGPGGLTAANLTNAGSLPGVANAFEARAYQNRPNVYRAVEGVLGGAATGADYRVYWGATAGAVDSVVDITNNVKLSFNQTMYHGYTWGFLTTAGTAAAGSGDGRGTVLSVTDLGCVAPIHADPTLTPPEPGNATPDGHLGCSAGTNYHFVNTAALGQIAMGNGVAADGSGAAVRPNNGFGMYLAGHFFLFEMAAPATLPSSTVWTMRSYVGAIAGGGGSVGQAGNLGAYSFTAVASPLTAVGASLKAAYSVTNSARQATRADLDAVHTVPDPYYVTNAFESSPSGKVIKFVNLPIQAIIRIYSTSGVLVRVLEHNASQLGGMESWDVRNRNNQVVASGVYFYHIESPSGARRVGRMTIVNFAQ